jgi:hypothetical protein
MTRIVSFSGDVLVFEGKKKIGLYLKIAGVAARSLKRKGGDVSKVFINHLKSTPWPSLTSPI